MQIQEIIDDAVNFRFDGYLILGDSFGGVIRNVRIINRTPCLTDYPETLTTNSTLCTNSANETCSFCDILDSCYGNCNNISYWWSSHYGC